MLAFQQWLSAKTLQSQIKKITENITASKERKVAKNSSKSPNDCGARDTIASTNRHKEAPYLELLSQWKMVHAHYILMGGFAFSTEKLPYTILPGNRTRAVITSHGFLHLLKHYPELIPIISEEAIQDKSKGNALAKTLVCLEALWFIIQTI
jgi:hypothetical protein